MLRKQLAATAITAAVLSVPGVGLVSAQEGAPVQCPQQPSVSVSSPSSGVTVGRQFTLAGKVTVGQGDEPVRPVYLEIDDKLYVHPDNRNADPYQQYFTPLTDNLGNYSFTIDLTGDRVTEEYVNGQYVRYPLSDGQHKFSVYTFAEGPYGEAYAHCPGPEGPKELLLTVKSDAPSVVSQQQSRLVQRPKPSPLASESPSPSVAPVKSDEVKVDDDQDMKSWLWALLAFVIGGLTTGLAEYSAVRYHRKHPPKKR